MTYPPGAMKLGTMLSLTVRIYDLQLGVHYNIHDKLGVHLIHNYTSFITT